MSSPFSTRHYELVQIVEAAHAESVRKAGEWLRCRPGCSQCCYGPFAISQLDVLRLREGMNTLRQSDPARAQRLQRRAAEWLQRLLPDFPGDAATGLLSTDEASQARFEHFANDEPCPALNVETGTCEIYEWRPVTCRIFGPPVRSEEGIGHCELCFHGATQEQVVACEMPLPHQLEAELIKEAEAQLGVSGETLVAFALARG